MLTTDKVSVENEGKEAAAGILMINCELVGCCRCTGRKKGKGKEGREEDSKHNQPTGVGQIDGGGGVVMVGEWNGMEWGLLDPLTGRRAYSIFNNKITHLYQFFFLGGGGD